MQNVALKNDYKNLTNCNKNKPVRNSVYVGDGGESYSVKLES